MLSEINCFYNSPLGKMIISSNGKKIVRAEFYDSEQTENICTPFVCAKDDLFLEVKCWLDDYFLGKNPPVNTKLFLLNGSDFRLSVWNEIMKIKYGKTKTYVEIAKILAKKRGIEKMSAQAVGHAASLNKINIIIPCHRVIGSNGSMVGYRGDVWRKEYLLKLEKGKF